MPRWRVLTTSRRLPATPRHRSPKNASRRRSAAPEGAVAAGSSLNYPAPAGLYPCYFDRIENCTQGEVAMRLSNESLLVILFVGLIAGWLAGKVVRGSGFGIIGDIVIGIAGAFVASFLFPKLGIHIGTGLISEIVYSAIGAIILLLVVRLVRGGGRF